MSELPSSHAYQAPNSGALAPAPDTIGGAVSELTRDLSTLMRQEVALAKAEARQSAVEAGRGIGLFAGAGVAGLLFLVFISIALWWGIGTSTGRGWARLIVAAIWLVIGVVLALVARSQLQRAKGLPQ